MDAGDSGFDALSWAARTLAWEWRLRELEETATPEQQDDAEVTSWAGFAYPCRRLAT